MVQGLNTIHNCLCSSSLLIKLFRPFSSLHRRRTSSNPDSPMSASDPNGGEVIAQVPQASQSAYLQPRYVLDSSFELEDPQTIHRLRFLFLRYFEHPLSAATSAMLAANGASNQVGNPNEDDSQENGSALNMNNLVTSHQVHQVNNPNGSTTYLYEYYKVAEKDSGHIQWR